MPDQRFPWRMLLIILVVALVSRLILLASNAVSFHADEAVVGLMARHILAGERPTFFYGQAYMGSLDAWLIALGFRLLGDSVLTIRLVQSALYMLVVASGFLLAWRLSERKIITTTAGLVLAIPPVNSALYTTATLGGYNETLLFGTLILLMAYEVTHDHNRSWWRWGLLGLCAGLGWWTNGLIAVYVLPAGLLILYTLLKPLFSRRNSTSPSSSQHSALSTQHFSSQSSVLSPQHFFCGIAIALALFLIGSAPWWIFDFTHNHAALATFLSSRQSGEFEGIGLPYVPPPQRAIGLVFIGLPALIGMRFPWSSDYFLAPVGILMVLIYAIAIFRMRKHNPLKPDARGLLLGMLGLFCVVFVASTFGADPTGRYLLPLLLPLGIILGAMVDGFQMSDASFQPETDSVGTRHVVSSSAQKYLPYIAVTLVIAYHAAGQFAAMTTPPGITTQFDLASHIPNDHDAELVAFLDENGLYNGYSNYWVTFRLAYLSDERMQYSAALPYKTNLDYNAADNRYPLYAQATEAAESIAVITTNLPELDTRLVSKWDVEGITYRQHTIGVYHIYYAFDPTPPRPPLFE